MEQREKLIEILTNAVDKTNLVDHLLANGVVVLPCKVGDTVWVVERDEYGDPCEVSGYIFLAACLDYVIVSPSINGSDDIRYIVEYHAEKTAEEYEAGLPVFRAEDCYDTREEAKKALEKRKGGDE